MFCTSSSGDIVTCPMQTDKHSTCNQIIMNWMNQCWNICLLMCKTLQNGQCFLELGNILFAVFSGILGNILNTVLFHSKPTRFSRQNCHQIIFSSQSIYLPSKQANIFCWIIIIMALIYRISKWGLFLPPRGLKEDRIMWVCWCCSSIRGKAAKYVILKILLQKAAQESFPHESLLKLQGHVASFTVDLSPQHKDIQI